MNSIKFTPVSKYVWVYKEQVEKVEEVSKGGILLGVEQKVLLQERGVVAGIGILCDEKVQKVIRVGDTIMFEGGVQRGKVVDGQEFLLIIDSNVMAKL